MTLAQNYISHWNVLTVFAMVTAFSVMLFCLDDEPAAVAVACWCSGLQAIADVSQHYFVIVVIHSWMF